MSKICVKCSTKNEDNFSFCKYCGAALPEIIAAPTNTESLDTPPSTFKDRALNLDFDGVTHAELENYVGKNSKRVMPKFIGLKLFGRKTSFSWPVLILGFLFGFYGMAVYFFSRKVFPVALALTLCGVALSAGVLATRYEADSKFFDSYFVVVNDMFANPESYTEGGEQKISDTLSAMYGEYQENIAKSQGYAVFSFIDLWLARSLLPVIFSAFAPYLYYKSAVGRIKKVKEKHPENPKKLARAGGFSVVFVLVPPLVSLFVGFVNLILVLL